MSAQTSYPNPPSAIVSPHFLAPYPVDLTIVRKLMSLSDGNFAVTDVNGNVMFKVKAKHFSIRDRRVLLDASGVPVLSFQKKERSYIGPTDGANLLVKKEYGSEYESRSLGGLGR
ncbi:LURP-one-related 10-like protein [Tanacetum coccineum]